MMCDDSITDDEKYRVYLEERAKLVQFQAEETHKFDKAILTLAGGAFGFSLAFIKEIVPSVKPGTYAWLLACWCCFGLSLLATMVSFLVSQSACKKQIKIMEEDFFSKNGKKDKELPRNKLAAWTLSLNIGSIAAFVLGVGLLVVFVAVNVPH